jgi:hypothetical protein
VALIGDNELTFCQREKWKRAVSRRGVIYLREGWDGERRSLVGESSVLRPR